MIKYLNPILFVLFSFVLFSTVYGTHVTYTDRKQFKWRGTSEEIDSLTLSGYDWKDQDLILLQKLPRLKALYLDDAEIGDDGYLLLSEVAPQLERLVLRPHMKSIIKGTTFVEMIQNLPMLEEFDLSSTMQQYIPWNILAKAFENSSIKKLHLRDYVLGPRSDEAIAIWKNTFSKMPLEFLEFSYGRYNHKPSLKARYVPLDGPIFPALRDFDRPITLFIHEVRPEGPFPKQLVGLKINNPEWIPKLGDLSNLEYLEVTLLLFGPGPLVNILGDPNEVPSLKTLRIPTQNYIPGPPPGEHPQLTLARSLKMARPSLHVFWDETEVFLSE